MLTKTETLEVHLRGLRTGDMTAGGVIDSCAAAVPGCTLEEIAETLSALADEQRGKALADTLHAASVLTAHHEGRAEMERQLAARKEVWGF
jgi:hypothetical protein